MASADGSALAGAAAPNRTDPLPQRSVALEMQEGDWRAVLVMAFGGDAEEFCEDLKHEECRGIKCFIPIGAPVFTTE